MLTPWKSDINWASDVASVTSQDRRPMWLADRQTDGWKTMPISGQNYSDWPQNSSDLPGLTYWTNRVYWITNPNPTPLARSSYNLYMLLYSVPDFMVNTVLCKYDSETIWQPISSIIYDAMVINILSGSRFSIPFIKLWSWFLFKHVTSSSSPSCQRLCLLVTYRHDTSVYFCA